MNYTIYQPKEINFFVDDDKTDYAKNEYKNVYEGEIENQGSEIATLEKLFTIFNIAHPEDFKGHSLSTNDIVELEGKAYLCDIIGWKEINLA